MEALTRLPVAKLGHFDPDGLFEPVSLGIACETKYQLARVLNARFYPEQSEMAFRYAMRQSDHAAATFGWRLFDWQHTPLSAVCEFIERDFQGLFEREDLQPSSVGVTNVRFGTIYAHEFIASTEGQEVSVADVDRQYPAFRRLYDRLADDFRQLLRQPGPYLYVWGDPAHSDRAEIERLIGLLSRHPEHRFHLLVVGHDRWDGDYSDLGGKVTKAWRFYDERGKPAKFWWEGHDLSWDQALAPFRLTLGAGGLHDPLAPVERAAPNRPRQGGTPPPSARVIWSAQGEAVRCWLIWRNAGASVTMDGAEAHIVTAPAAWQYSQTLILDFSGIDLEAQRAWVRLELADVRGPLLVSLFNPDHDNIREEVMVSEGPQTVLFFKVGSLANAQLLFRTGGQDEAAHAVVRNVQVLTGSLPA